MIPFFILAGGLALGLPPLVRFGTLRGWLPETPTFLMQTTWVVALMTAIIFVYLYRADKGAWFVQLYLLSMAVKLLAYFGYNLIVILDDPRNAVANVVYFLSVYVLFTALEIVFLYKKISPPPAP